MQRQLGKSAAPLVCWPIRHNGADHDTHRLRRRGLCVALLQRHGQYGRLPLKRAEEWLSQV
eukprot:4111040-Pleurochrysis_carterae.AAC.1